MAANSGGVEWASIIKPIVSPYTYNTVNKYDLLELCSAINKRYTKMNDFTTFLLGQNDLTIVTHYIFHIKYIFYIFSGSEILHHKDNFKVFYNSFAIIAADYINVNSTARKLLCY